MYTVKPGKEKEFQALLDKHWPTLDAAGLVADEPPRVWRATNDRSQAVVYAEMMSWKNEEAAGIAHQTPEVMAVWEPMGNVLDDLQILTIEPVSLPIGDR